MFREERTWSDVEESDLFVQKVKTTTRNIIQGVLESTAATRSAAIWWPR